MGKIILFDGVCVFCNWNVQFIIQRDPSGYFLFAPLQSEYAQYLLTSNAISQDEDSLILFDNNQYFVQSTAALKIARHLRGLYPILYMFIIVPPPIRDAIYRFVAKNRYKWFGKKNHCMIPTPEQKSRFLT